MTLLGKLRRRIQGEAARAASESYREDIRAATDQANSQSSASRQVIADAIVDIRKFDRRRVGDIEDILFGRPR